MEKNSGSDGVALINIGERYPKGFLITYQRPRIDVSIRDFTGGARRKLIPRGVDTSRKRAPRPRSSPPMQKDIGSTTSNPCRELNRR